MVKKRLGSFFKGTYLGLMLLFLYAPIVILIIFSFNGSKTLGHWVGFSFQHYVDLFKSNEIMDALGVTLSVAAISSVVATVFGTMAAIGIHSMRRRKRAVIESISQLPMVNPDLMTGVSLMLLFLFIGPEGWLHEASHCPYHLQPAVRDLLGTAETPPEQQHALRSGARPWLYPYPRPLEGRDPGYPAGYRFRLYPGADHVHR